MIAELQSKLGVTFFPHQAEAFEWVEKEQPERLCFYYPTGKGKTLTSLVSMKLLGQNEVLVVAPPATHPEWMAAASKVGLYVMCISHAKFRQKGYALSRRRAIIADEFHLFGGHTGQGWLKLKRLSLSLEAPLILMSATPNYNDAERVYCLQSILDAPSVAGGFIQFLYTHCKTEQNPFGMTPLVNGFLHFPSAVEYLASLRNVLFIPDELVYQIEEVPLVIPVNDAFESFGYDERGHRIMASLMETRHRRVFNALVADDGGLSAVAWTELLRVLLATSGQTLVYCDHATVAAAVALTLQRVGTSAALVTGQMTANAKHAALATFKAGGVDVLVGTASLATGTDGLDKVCDLLVIVDDTDDASLRRQLIGRIMPRGEDDDASGKRVVRFNLS